MSIDPIRVFEVKNNVSTIACSANTLTVGTNRLVVTAVTAKRIRVMGWVALSTTSTAGTFGLKSASAGTVILTGIGAPPSTVGMNNQMVIADSGYAETNTGEGLYADVITADIYLNVFYIVYTP